MSKLMKTRETAKTTSQIFNFVVVHPAFHCWGMWSLYHCFSLFLCVFFLQLRHNMSKNNLRKKERKGLTCNPSLPLVVSDSLWLSDKCCHLKLTEYCSACFRKWPCRSRMMSHFTAHTRAYLNVHLNIIKQEITCSISPAMAIESGACGLWCPLTWNSNPIRALFPASWLPALKTHLPCF